MPTTTKEEMKPYVSLSPMTPEEQAVVNRVYREVKHMINLRNLNYTQFNERTLKQFIDDSDKRMNSYAPTRESQGKEDWQANVALPTVRDKLKRVIAGYSLEVPEMKVEAYRESGEMDVASIDRGDIAKRLIYSSYLENDNPVIENFWEAWEASVKGTVIKYEGYLKATVKQKYIKSYEPASGKIEFEEREVDVNDKLISHLVPLTELYITNYYTYDIQEQDAIAWIKYFTPERFKRDYGNYHNADKVETAGGLKEDTSTFYKKDHQWEERAGKDKIEVIRYYNHIEDEYFVIANGVLLLDAPLLWMYNGKKVYPFAKSILEPFVGKDFFYGKSFPEIMMGQYDLLNTYFNSIMDKGFRSLNPPTLIGSVNQDMFDLEDEILSTSTKIYVDDVNQVKPMPIENVSQADVAMIEMLSRGLEDAVPSMPHLMQNKQATAREVVITQERMQELKSIYNETLVDLWRQKYQLRLANIMVTYPLPKKVVKDGKVKEVYRTFVIKNTIVDNDTKERGVLAIQFRKLTPKQKKDAEQQASAERMAMETKGVNYRKKIIDPEYFNSYLYKVIISPESLHRKSMALRQSTIIEELQIMAQLFPQIFIANQQEYFEDVAGAYGRDPQVALARLSEMAQQGAERQEGMSEEGGGEQTQGLQQTMQNTL
jgi:hypothetical protein